MIHVVGHFGTEFSYATVASHVASSLIKLGALGRITNLDPDWHPRFERFAEAVPSAERCDTCFVVARPGLHDPDPGCRSYVFASPNTDSLSPEDAEYFGRFDTVVCPSRYCESVVKREGAKDVVWWPLGCDKRLFDGRSKRIEEKIARIESGKRPLMLHVSTDQRLPGRKGTQELVAAWEEAQVDAELLLHLPPAIAGDVAAPPNSMKRVAAMKGNASEVLDLVCEADVLVAPSRCEGFGLMLLAALAAGTPLVSTVHTGHADFLAPRASAVAGLVAAPEVGPLEGEHGCAPMVSPEAISGALRRATPDARARALRAMAEMDMGSWAWDQRGSSLAYSMMAE